MLKLNMLYIFGSNHNLEQSVKTNFRKIDANSPKKTRKKQFFTPLKIIICTFILTLFALSIWQKDKIFSFFKGKKTDKNSDSQNNIENDVEIFEVNNTNIYKDSNGREFEILDCLYYKKDPSKKILIAHLKESFYYILIKKNDKDYLIKSNIIFEHEPDSESKDELREKQREILDNISKNINKENKIECKIWDEDESYCFDNENNNYYICMDNGENSLVVPSEDLFILTEEDNKKYVQSIALKDVKRPSC